MINLKEKLDSNLSASVRNVLRTIKAHKKDVNIYLVGGVVRDLLLGREIFDVDITVEGDAVKLARYLEKKGVGKIKQIQKDLRTAKMKFDNGVEIDFASTRKESYPRKGHLPITDEIGVSLEEDVKRRDYTVNSLALSLNDEDYGSVKDFVGGLDDLDDKLLRVLHDDSFIDDPTRIIRALKFSVRFGFVLDVHSKDLQRDYLDNKFNTNISFSRVKSELMQTFSLNLPQAYEEFIKQGMYKLINPSFDAEFDAHKAPAITEKYLPKHIWMVYTAQIFYGSPFLDLFGLTKTEKKIVYDFEKLLQTQKNDDNFSIYKRFAGISLESLLSYYLYAKDYTVLLYLDKLSNIKPILNGSDLINLGFLPSEEFGTIFESVLKEKLAGRLLTKDEELDFVKNKFL